MSIVDIFLSVLNPIVIGFSVYYFLSTFNKLDKRIDELEKKIKLLKNKDE